MEFNGLDRYCLYNLSLNLIDLRIFSVIHDLILCLCLLNLIFFARERTPSILKKKKLQAVFNVN